MLRVISALRVARDCIRLRPGYLSVRVGGDSLRSEGDSKKSRFVPFSVIISIHISFVLICGVST